MPGLIDTHTHLFQVLGRGLGDGLELMAWLREFMLPMSVHLTTDDVVAAVRPRLAAVGGRPARPLSWTTTTPPPTPSPRWGWPPRSRASGCGAPSPAASSAAASRASDRMGVPDELHAYTAAEELQILEECLDERPARVAGWRSGPCPRNVVYVHRDLIAGLRSPGRRAGPALAGPLQRGPGGGRHLLRHLRRAACRVAQPGRPARAAGHPGSRHLARRRRGGRHGRRPGLCIAPAGVQPGHLVGRDADARAGRGRAPLWV